MRNTRLVFFGLPVIGSVGFPLCQRSCRLDWARSLSGDGRGSTTWVDQDIHG